MIKNKQELVKRLCKLKTRKLEQEDLSQMTMNDLLKMEYISLEKVSNELYSSLLGTHYKKTIYLKEDIVLDSLDLDILYKEIDILIIDGNLKVNGSIYNLDGDAGCSLIVTGNVEADALIGGGSEIYLKGKSIIHTFVIGHYNHGVLSVPNVETLVYINNDHQCDMGDNIAYSYNIFENMDEFVALFPKNSSYFFYPDNYNDDIEEYAQYCELEEDKFYNDVINRDSCIEIIEGIITIENDKFTLLKKDGMFLESIENPTKEMKEIAVRNNGLALQFIENPTEKMKKIAIKENGFAIQFIENPTEEMKELAVEENSKAIQFIENPSEELQVLAVTYYGWAIQYISNPSTHVKKLASNSMQ